MHNELNPEQREAVLHKEGPLLILAGAGAGKTRVVVHRIAELIKSGVPPERILAVTFTNKAAGEMKERIRVLTTTDPALSPYDSPKTYPFVGTFHALSLHIIKTFHTKAGLPKRFTIFDRADSTKAVKKAMEIVGFDPKQLEPRRVLSIMGRAKGEALSVTQFREEKSSSYIDEAVADVWEEYETILKKEKALDFDDILLTAYTLLKRDGEVRDYFQNQWDFVHVDEYQDTNRVQYELIRILSEKHHNVCAVGDADQNIYSWRGASLDHILNFEYDYKDATIILLTQNYRSTKTIIQAANDAISKNIKRKEKELFTKNADGEPISIVGQMDEIAEARFVVDECKKIIRFDDAKAEDIAVLYRANFQSRVLEEAFLGSGVPYQVLGTRFFERKEIKDALSYIRLAVNPENTTDLSRIINVPARGIGKVTLAKVLSNDPTLTGAQKKKVDDFFSLISRITQKLSKEKVSDTVRYVLKESGMWALYEKGKGEDEERLQNIKELVTVATKYDLHPPEEGIEKLLEEAALQSDQDELPIKKEDRPGVKLMTIHAAKGLEFPYVFITGLEDGLFPHERDGGDANDDEEERRLFYVALTRAEKKVYLSYALSRRIFGTRSMGMPSEFINEIDSSLAEVLATPDWRDYDEPDEVIT